MKDINYLIGDETIKNQGLPIFSDSACNFLDDLSKAILASSESKIYPDLVSFAFWIRKANIQRLKTVYSAKENRIGKGLCLHIAPSNIPINFAFSYVFSLLAGNSNIVRLPSKQFPQVDILLKIAREVLKKHPEILSRTAFVTYPRESSATQELSLMADARMIWGGDSTIHHIRSLKTRPRVTDIPFADRYSICLIDANAILKGEEAELTRLAENFYNDTYLMDQNACSSPQLIYWLHPNPKAKEIFWEKVFQVAQKKYNLQDSVAVDKYSKLCQDLMAWNNVKSVNQKTNLLYAVSLKEVDADIEKCRGNCGYFYEYDLNDINEMLNVVSDKYQTLTYHGIDPKSIQKMILEKGLRGIDRIVPIGKAMDIDVIWDGHDLIVELSREITAL